METKTEKKLKPEEIEEIVITLAKNKVHPAKIGLILKEKHGIPRAKLAGKKICVILKENGLYLNPDKTAISSRVENLKKHVQKNRQDKKAKRGLQIVEARLRKASLYEKRNIV